MNLYIFEIQLTYAKNKSLLPIQAITWHKALETVQKHPSLSSYELTKLVTPQNQHIENPGNPADYDLNIN